MEHLAHAALPSRACFPSDLSPEVVCACVRVCMQAAGPPRTSGQVVFLSRRVWGLARYALS